MVDDKRVAGPERKGGVAIRTDHAETVVRAARELLRWDQERLAHEAGIGIVAVRRFESGGRVRAELVARMFLALQVAGLIVLGRTEVDGVSIEGGIALEPWVRPEPRRPTRVYRLAKGTVPPEAAMAAKPRRKTPRGS